MSALAFLRRFSKSMLKGAVRVPIYPTATYGLCLTGCPFRAIIEA